MTAVWTEEALARRGLRIRESSRAVAMPADAVTLELPTPPSVNNAWTNVPGTGRVRSPGYRRWHKQAFDELGLQSPGRIHGKFAVVINVARIKGRADVDNRIKPILDLLAGTVTDDDANCERVSAGWSDDLEPGRVTVIVRRAAA